MGIGSLLISPTWLLGAIGGIALGGVLLWWFVRKRHKRMWLPTLRVVRLETRLMPKLRVRTPPLVSFFCFLVAAIAMTMFALKPRKQVFTPYEPNQTRIHVFVDLSPSVSAHVSLDELTTSLQTLWNRVQETGRISVGFSHSAEILEPKTFNELANRMKSLGFHRPGLRIGEAVRIQLEQVGDIDRLFVVGDRDQFSWNGFNWRFLADETDILFVNLSKATEQNLYFDDIRFLSTPSSRESEWDVEIVRNGAATDKVGGTLKAFLQVGSTQSLEMELTAIDFGMSEGTRRVSVRTGWSQTKAEEFLISRNKKGAQAHIMWRLEVSGSDSMELDNYFRTPVFGMKRDVLMVAEALGEQTLDDPAHQLQVSLNVLGFNTRRIDQIEPPGPEPSQYPFWVILGGTHGAFERYCPRTIETARVTRIGKQGAKDLDGSSFPKVWLAPIGLNVDYSDLCRCFVRLVKSESAGENPDYCKNVTTRNEWAGLLPSLGAKQIGGELGDASRSIAWTATDKVTGTEVLAMTIPLNTIPGQGTFRHSDLPILTRWFLSWQGLLDTESKDGGATAWQRMTDVTANWSQSRPEAFVETALSNVPLGESALTSAENSELPPQWSTQTQWAQETLPARKDQEDPLPWLKLLVLIIIAALLVEAFWISMTRILKALRSGEEITSLSSLWLVAAIGLLAGIGTEAQAQVQIIELKGFGTDDRYSRLSREVSHRTSVELNERSQAVAHGQVTGPTFNEPWLFVTSTSSLVDNKGRLLPDIAGWIRRGGLLVVQQSMPMMQLEKLTQDLAEVRGGEWKPIPPDHELMRSFYLLDALPPCQGNVWRGFHYDSRLAILSVPFNLTSLLEDRQGTNPCKDPPTSERLTRVFVNLVMVALATDYKKDQIHLPEILKRLR